MLPALSYQLRPPPLTWMPATTGHRRITIYSDMTTSEMVRMSIFRVLWLLYMLGTLGGFIAISVSAKYGTEVVRLTPQLAAFATALFSIFNGAGRPIFRYFSDMVGIK
ncbi:MAG: hypothetical protein QW756_06755 [Nitrososphaerota archaeon]